MSWRMCFVSTCGALWLLSIGAGARAVWDYQTTPGAAAEAPAEWPRTTLVTLTPGRPTLVLAAHPQCPCTRATLSELARLVDRLQGHLSVHVLVYKPSEFPEAWARTDVWEAAERIPGVTVHVDVDGTEAARFGAVTSGQVLLYDAAGRQRFRGGLTNARGHVGESVAHRRIAEVVEGRDVADMTTRVFGCALAGAAQAD